MKRRTFLAAGLSLPLALSGVLPRRAHSEVLPDSSVLDLRGEAFVRDMQRRCYRYFLEAVDLKTQLVADRAATDASNYSLHGSSAACGFGLASHAIAAQYEWAPREEIQQRVRTMLHSLNDLVAHEKGFVYHFFDIKTGQRMLRSEASSVDTALMLAGAMSASVAFQDDSEIGALAEQLYNRVEWTWLLGENGCLHMGYLPEIGILPHQWDQFSEHLILTLLAIGAPSNPIPPSSWDAWRREPVLKFQGQEFLSYPPLFVHQYPMAFFDFQNYRAPNGRSFWENAKIAHHAQINFLTKLGAKYPQRMGHYGPDLWGITSSDSEFGYRDWGGPYKDGRVEPDREIDGTIVPSAAAGALAVLPHEALHTLEFQKDRFGEKIYGHYGFVNAFNPANDWVNPDVIGIDTGISLMMAENMLTGRLWNLFMQHPAAQRGLKLAGFTQTGSTVLTSRP
ncbi:glucoamylase family protein [Bremerella alba]|uniref:Glycoamylase-like domain-containing protein n=1 Tax=Bremerella alba TaxID=980252 RepID=A0A7V8V806_9BACT|nr:glucoamylase family protein [Bremerella alba]MBA2116593.1 hypothetical protein [Bremerella alba]